MNQRASNHIATSLCFRPAESPRSHQSLTVNPTSRLVGSPRAEARAARAPTANLARRPDSDGATLIAVAPVPPPSASALFGDRLPLAVQYADWLTGEGVRRGIIGPHEAERIWPRHLINCAVVAALVTPGSLVVDLGSGAGLPGVVLAIARPDIRVVLVESLLRRSTFLGEVVAALRLDAVTVRRARAEELATAGLDADIVTARAVAPVARLCRWAAPLLSPRGCLVALKGDGIAEELMTGWRSIRTAGFGGDVELLSLETWGADKPPASGATRRNVRVSLLQRWSGMAAPTGMEIGDVADRAALAVRLWRRQQDGHHGRSALV